MSRYAAIWTAFLRGALLVSSVCLAGAGGNPDNPLFKPGPGYAAIVVMEVSVLLDAVTAWYAAKKARATGFDSDLAGPMSIVNYFVAAIAFLVLLFLLGFGDWVPGRIAWPIRILLLILFLGQGLIV